MRFLQPSAHLSLRHLKQGFGAVEIMVTVAIMGILAAVATPTILDTMQRRKVIAAANEIASIVGYGRAEAIATQTGIDVSFDAGAHSHGVSCVQVATTSEGISRCNCWDTDIAKACTKKGSALTGGNMLRVFSIPVTNGVTFDTADIEWPSTKMKGRFHISWPRLTTNLPETVQVTVEGSRGFKLRVDITPVGRVSICAPGHAEAGYPLCDA